MFLVGNFVVVFLFVFKEINISRTH